MKVKLASNVAIEASSVSARKLQTIRYTDENASVRVKGKSTVLALAISLGLTSYATQQEKMRVTSFVLPVKSQGIRLERLPLLCALCFCALGYCALL